MELQHIHVYDHFCNDLSLSSALNHIKTMFLVFQKNADIRAAYESIYDECPFLDWDQLENIRNYRGYKDTATWIRLSLYLQMRADDITWKGFVQQHKVFYHFYQSLQSAKLEIAPAQAAHLFLLINIINLQAMNVMEMYFSMVFDRAVQKEALLFFSVLANMPFDRADRTAALVALLSSCLEVDVRQFEAEVELERSKESKLSQIFKQKHMQATTLRPRLRSKIKQDALQGSALATLDNFKPWCDTIRFPNVFSISHKKRLYFTMSQTALDFTTYIHKYVSERDIAQIILQYHVKNPDVDVLTDTILQARITSEPFAELHKFRNQCFHCFSVQQKSLLRLNDLLHLYMAAYQPPTVWKAVWKTIIPILSIQIIKDVEAFTADNEINHEAVMAIVYGDAKPP
jgi:hypothetical protein